MGFSSNFEILLSGFVLLVVVSFSTCKDLCNNLYPKPITPSQSNVSAAQFTPSQLPLNHQIRAALQFSKNETWKQKMYEKFTYSMPSEKEIWHSVFPHHGRSNLEDHEGEDGEHSHSHTESHYASTLQESDWMSLFGRMRSDLEVNPPKAQILLEEVPLSKVRLDPGSIHGIAQNTHLEFMMLLDVDNLLHGFRTNAGLPAPGQPYGGWEDPTSQLRGHFVGHYMSSTAMLWASTQNETIKKRMTYVVSVLGECQRAIGTGYLSAFPTWEFDNLETLKNVWAPYYTIHKIMAGLLDQYTIAGNTEAYNITVWMAEYFYNRIQNVIKQYTIERHWDTLNDESGGMNDVMYRLYSLTGNPKHLEMGHLFDKPCFLGMLAIKADDISQLHVNTHLAVLLGAQMRYEVVGDPLYKDIATFFMDIVTSSHVYATGGSSRNEHWVDPKRLATELGTENEETCTTYNMLKIARHLFRWTKEMAYADYYERALTNGILGIQRGTDPGKMIYMLPQGSGVSKARSHYGWGDAHHAFWCCYGTASESFSKLGDSIYFQEKGSSNLYIIQFISSKLTWDSVGLALTQIVQPLSSLDPYLKVSMEFSELENAKTKNMEVTIYIRIPFWTTQEASAMLNVERLSLPNPGSFLMIKRKLASGDKLSFSFPVSLRTETIKDDRPKYQTLQAIMFGPYVLVGMSDGDRDIQIPKTSSISDWIKPVPASYQSQLFSFSQEGKLSGLSAFDNNNTLVFRFNNHSQVFMDHFANTGTDEAAHATFRIVDATSPNREINPKSVTDFVGKNVYLESFFHPGWVVSHNGIDKDITISQSTSISLGDENYGCSLRSCGAVSFKTNASADIFKVWMGLDGNANSISFESTNRPSCFLYGVSRYQVGQAVQLKCAKSRDLDFIQAVTFNAIKGISTYHPLSFIAKGLYNSYHLEPIMALRDESYTAYLNITTIA